MEHDLAKKGHSADELRFGSNLGHWIEGGLLATVGVLALLELIGVLAGGWIYVWPAVLVVAGIVLPLGIFGHGHGEDARASRAAILADPQQKQHLIMAGLLFLAGLAEIVGIATEFSFLFYVWPVVLVIIGVMFMIHTQHGTSAAASKAVRIHRILGGTLSLAGLARAISLITGIDSGIVGLAWIILVLAAAVQLLVYREPEGAYEEVDPSEH